MGLAQICWKKTGSMFPPFCFFDRWKQDVMGSMFCLVSRRPSQRLEFLHLHGDVRRETFVAGAMMGFSCRLVGSCFP